MRRSTLPAFLVLLLLVAASPALAHAFPDHAAPAVGGIVAQPPKQVQIWFTEKLESSFSRIEVLDASGKRVDAGNSSVDAQDPRLLRVSVKNLSPGTYKVVWHVVSVDTHATEGDFTFTVSG
jgi:methionine-rich copper-binding protein CopC